VSFNTDLASLVALHLCHATQKQVQQAQTFFGDLNTALKASQADWMRAAILSDKQMAHLQSPGLVKEVEATLQWGEQPGQSLLGLADSRYPSLLSRISDAPILLSVRGQVALLNDPQLAIVGSRHASKQGLNTAKDFAQHLSAQGLTITSGLALGIDTAAHQGGLQGLGKTIAVVATGLDRIYPAANQALGRQIAEEGAMVSEFPLGTQPLAYHFPKRNRIISGLSVGTLVIEAALQSGSLITAKTANEQGREVFAVPGSINNPQAKGCHQLIKQGAKLVESGQDVLEELAPLIQLTAQAILPLNDQTVLTRPGQSAHPKILEFIEYDPIGLDELVVLSKCAVSDIQSQLMLLTMAGEIEALSAGRWRRIK
jgi:DNA processing protein